MDEVSGQIAITTFAYLWVRCSCQLPKKLRNGCQ